MEDAYKDESWLRVRYFDNGETVYEMAEKAGVEESTIRYWMEKYGMERRPRGYNSRAKPPRMKTSASGYECFQVQHGDEYHRVSVHQLLVIHDGADPSKVFSDGVEVHHDNGIPWDNRANNLRLMEKGEHAYIHAVSRGDHGRWSGVGQ